MKLGRFYVTSEFYRNPEIMIALQRDMAVLNVRIAYDVANSYEFMATGEMFDHVPEYEIVPEYKVMFVPADKVKFKFERIES